MNLAQRLVSSSHPRTAGKKNTSLFAAHTFQGAAGRRRPLPRTAAVPSMRGSAPARAGAPVSLDFRPGGLRGGNPRPVLARDPAAALLGSVGNALERKLIGEGISSGIDAFLPGAGTALAPVLTPFVTAGVDAIGSWVGGIFETKFDYEASYQGTSFEDVANRGGGAGGGGTRSRMEL